MTNQRLWLEDSRERSLDNLADLLEGYYRCRNPGAQRPACGDRSYANCGSALDYLGYFNRLGYAYATLPLRLLSQLYGCSSGVPSYAPRDCAPAVADCGPAASSDCGRATPERDCLVVQPARIALGRGGKRKEFSHFSIKSSLGGTVTISFEGFKDVRGALVHDADLKGRDEIGDWVHFSKAKPMQLHLDEGECRNITVQASVASAPAGACLRGKLRITTESGFLVRVEIDFAI